MQLVTIYRFGMPFHVAEKNHIFIPFQNDIRPLSNSVPEDVGKADQLKDEGRCRPQRLLSAALEVTTPRWQYGSLRCQDMTVVIPVAL